MMSIKNYKCCGSSCSKKRQEKTNHYGKIYNIFCPVCATEGRSPLQSWECTDPIPEDGWVPPEWIEDKISISEAADLQEEAEAMGWDD